nr:S41 family peptidase [Polymorphobacter multimanifer]
MAAAPVLAAEPARDIAYGQDFDELWRTLGERYCFFGNKATNWVRVRELYRPEAIAATSPEDLSRVLAKVLAELYDAHTHLADPPAGTPRFPPFDLVVEPDGMMGVVLSVAEHSAAQQAGLRVGDAITHVEGVPVPRAAAERMPRCLTRADPAANTYAWNGALAGRRGQPRRLTLKGGGELLLPLVQGADEQPLAWRRLHDGLGMIRIGSFADEATVAAFDAGMMALRYTRGLIIDVRANGGGDTAVARPIMGRFTESTRPYARMRRRDGAGLGAFWTEVVEPRGPFTYSNPVVVLCDRWSASMAEGFPMGMKAICGARIVGQPMMGLGAAVFRLRLDRSGIEVQYSAEPVYDVHDRPRSDLRPDLLVPDGGDVLAAGSALLRQLAG